MFTEGVGPAFGRVFRRFRSDEQLEDPSAAQLDEVPPPSTPEPALLPAEPAAAPLALLEAERCWHWTGECGEASKLSRALVDLAAASSIAAVNISVQASRAGDKAQPLLAAADDLDRIAAQTREAAQRLAAIAECLESDIAEALHACLAAASEWQPESTPGAIAEVQ